MNPTGQNQFEGSFGKGEFESTLRLIARLPAPEGLEDRVQAGLRAAASATPAKARILRWPAALRLDNAWWQNLARAAAAAAIVAVVVGGGWSVSSRFQPARQASAVAAPPHGAGQGGFSSAGAMRTPQTLNGPTVAPASVTQSAAVATPTKPVAKTPVRHGKPAAAKKVVAQKAAPTIQ